MNLQKKRMQAIVNNRETVEMLMGTNLQEKIPLLKNRLRPKILLNRKGVAYES